MRLSLASALALCLLPACGTVTGPILGLSTGGPSMCGAIWDDSDSTTSKVVTAVPLTIGGAVAGTVYGLGFGFYDDCKSLYNTKMHQRWDLYCDPFKSQWSSRSNIGAPAGVYTIYVDTVIVGMVKLEEESPYGEILRLAFDQPNVTKALEAQQGLSTWEASGKTFYLTSTKHYAAKVKSEQEAAARQQQAEETQAKKKQEAEAAEKAEAVKRESELIAKYGPMRTWHLKAEQIQNMYSRDFVIPERMSGEEREERVRSYYKHRLSEYQLIFDEKNKVIRLTFKH